MAVRQKLALKQAQTLALTPGLRQSIEVMLLSAQDLSQLVARQLEENPFLERDGPDEVGAGVGGSESDFLAEPAFDGGWEEERGYGSGGEIAAGTPSLELHLAQEARLAFETPQDLAIALALIAELDEAGYLPAEPLQGRVPAARLEPVLLRLQRLAPPGCFARSLGECLTLQLADRGELDEPFRRLLANLPLVAQGERARLLQATGLPAEELARRLARLRDLDPKPGLSFSPPETVATIPDLLVTLDERGRPQVHLNQEALPRVRVNLHQRRDLKGRVRRREDRAYLAARTAEAGWLVRALARRGQSLLALGQELAVRQEDFFRGGGFPALKALTRREMAAALELSETSVSRLVANKTLAAPQGVLPLSRFFSPATAGGRTSQAAATARLAALIASEPPEAPLSDRRLAEELAGEGLVLARRTIAKYREMLKISGAAQRRREGRMGRRSLP